MKYLFFLFLVSQFLFINAESAYINTNQTEPSPWSFDDPIMIDPVGNHTVGDVFFMNGTINKSAITNLSINLDTFCNTFRPHMKSETYPEYITISDIPIIPGENGVNRWSLNFTDFAINLTPRKHCQGMVQHSNSTYLWSQCSPDCDHWIIFNDSGVGVDFFIFQQNENETSPPHFFGYERKPSEDIGETLQDFIQNKPTSYSTIKSQTSPQSPLPVELSLAGIAGVVILMGSRSKKNR